MTERRSATKKMEVPNIPFETESRNAESLIYLSIYNSHSRLESFQRLMVDIIELAIFHSLLVT